jgi:site-specific DNA-methyltransferase (adenine-specific)
MTLASPTTLETETARAGSVQRLVRAPFYSDDHVTIYHGNALEILPELKADVMVTDPPYGVNLGKHDGANEKRPGYLVKAGYDNYDDTPESYRELIVPILSMGIRMHDRAAIFGVVPNLWLLPAPSALGGVYLPAGCGRMPWGFQNLAPVIFYGKAPDLQLGSKATTIRSSDSAEENGHPCPKPVKWMTWLLDLTMRQNETVIDPFMGSGTTLRAAKDLNRRAIGIEINERYCEIAARRMSQGVLAL